MNEAVTENKNGLKLHEPIISTQSKHGLILMQDLSHNKMFLSFLKIHQLPTNGSKPVSNSNQTKKVEFPTKLIEKDRNWDNEVVSFNKVCVQDKQKVSQQSQLVFPQLWCSFFAELGREQVNVGMQHMLLQFYELVGLPAVSGRHPFLSANGDRHDIPTCNPSATGFVPCGILFSENIGTHLVRILSTQPSFAPHQARILRNDEWRRMGKLQSSLVKFDMFPA